MADQLLQLESGIDEDQNYVIEEGRPTIWEIVQETGMNFMQKMQSQRLKNDRQDLDSTSDIEEQDEDQLLFQPGPDVCTWQSEEVLLVSSSPNDDPHRKSSKEGKPKKKKKKATKKIKKEWKDRGSDTKNIPKNYGKQIIKFIKEHRKLAESVLSYCHTSVGYDEFNLQLKKKKKGLNKITDLRALWVDFSYAKEFRILSEIFVRKHCYQWIFNSRIEKIKFPIKYRYKIIEGIRKPHAFEYLKDF